MQAAHTEPFLGESTPKPASSAAGSRSPANGTVRPDGAGVPSSGARPEAARRRTKGRLSCYFTRFYQVIHISSRPLRRTEHRTLRPCGQPLGRNAHHGGRRVGGGPVPRRQRVRTARRRPGKRLHRARLFHVAHPAGRPGAPLRDRGGGANRLGTLRIRNTDRQYSSIIGTAIFLMRLCYIYRGGMRGRWGYLCG